MKTFLMKLFCFLFLIQFISCSKTDFLDVSKSAYSANKVEDSFQSLESDFFSISNVETYNFFEDAEYANLNEFARNVYKELQQQNTLVPFESDIVNRMGAPMWNNLLASNATKNYERYLMIPFDNELGEVAGLIYCVETSKGNYKFALIEKAILVDFIQNNPTAWNNIASYLVVSFHFFDQLIFGASNDVLLQFISTLNLNGTAANRDDCYSYYDCILPAWEGSQYANYDFVTGGVANVSMFLGNFLLNQNIAWLEIFYGGLECMEIEVCHSGPAIIFFEDDWVPGYTPINNSGGNTTNESPSGVNDNLNLTLEELDEFEMQLFLFANRNDLPFSIGELYNWVSYGCMDSNDRLDMECAWDSFLANFYHEDVDPFLLDMEISIEDLLNLDIDLDVCLNSNDFTACASEAILENRFEVVIVETYIIEGILMGVDSEGILHVDIDKISMQNSTRLEIFNQLLNVIKATRMLFCETEQYEPIDLRDYYVDLSAQFWTTTWEGHDNVSLDMQFQLNRYVINTSPNKANPDPQYTYLWYWRNTNIPGILISAPGSATSDLDEFFFFDCD